MIARQVIMRGREASRPTVVPLEGELIATTDTLQVYLGDGSTPGGSPIHPLNLVDRRVADHSSVTSVDGVILRVLTSGTMTTGTLVLQIMAVQ